MRLFLAIELPQEARDHLQQIRTRLAQSLPKLSYTKPENFHLTLKFLGELDAKRVDEVIDSLKKIKSTKLHLQATQIECFPAKGPIKIIAAALGGSLAPLRALVESVEQRTHYLGFEKEQRAYRPHVTLARARPVLSAKFRATTDECTIELWPGPAFTAHNFVLMQSKLTADGSVYIPLAHFVFF
jgi:2'-5' RNA ligase